MYVVSKTKSEYAAEKRMCSMFRFILQDTRPAQMKDWIQGRTYFKKFSIPSSVLMGQDAPERDGDDKIQAYQCFQLAISEIRSKVSQIRINPSIQLDLPSATT